MMWKAVARLVAAASVLGAVRLEAQRPQHGAPAAAAAPGAPTGHGQTTQATVTDSAAVADSARARGETGEQTPVRDPVAAATREYERTGVARVVDEGAFVTFPYGHAQPTVTCAPLRACVVELESGETVLSKIAGDTQRWEIQLAPAGADGRTPLVVVKPHDCGLTTNLVLATTAGRIYDLTLDSPPCPRAGLNPRGVYARHVRFYYPDAMVQSWSVPATPSPVSAAASVEAFNFAYRVTRDRHFPWVPVAVFDDGIHCYIKLPPGAAHGEAPVLFVLDEDGGKVLLNYSLSGDTYVTDRVFRAAALVVGDGGHERAVRLINLRYDGDEGAHRKAGGRDAAEPVSGER